MNCRRGTFPNINTQLLYIQRQVGTTGTAENPNYHISRVLRRMKTRHVFFFGAQHYINENPSQVGKNISNQKFSIHSPRLPFIQIENFQLKLFVCASLVYSFSDIEFCEQFLRELHEYCMLPWADDRMCNVFTANKMYQQNNQKQKKNSTFWC